MNREISILLKSCFKGKKYALVKVRKNYMYGDELGNMTEEEEERTSVGSRSQKSEKFC